MPKKKKHSPRTPKYTRSKSREYTSSSFVSQNSSTYPDSSYFAADQIPQTKSILSSTPVIGESESEIMIENEIENEIAAENSEASFTTVDDSQHDMDSYSLDQTSNNEGNESKHDPKTETTPIDNDSLLNSLQSQKGIAVPLKSMLKDLLDGFNHQLRLEIKSDMEQLLDTNKREISDFKSQIDSRISKIDTKIDSNIRDMNLKFDTLIEKVNQPENLISDEKMAKINSFIATNTTLTEKLDNHIRTTKSDLVEMKTKQSDLINSLEFLNKEVHDLREENELLKQKNAKLDIKVDNQGTYNRRLKTQVNNLTIEKTASDVRQRKLNLVFEGLEEEENDNPKKLVTDLLQKSGDLPNATDIDIAYRLGKITDGKTRPILVSFQNQAIKDNILKRANKIKQSSGNTALWINRDLPEITRRQTANTRRCYNLMKANKHDCMVQGTSITYKKKVYQYRDLNNLPAGSRLEDTRQIPCENGMGICFQGDLSYLSNFFPANLEYRNKEFVSSEQAFQWARATHANDHEAAKKILESEDPFTIKRYGEEVGDSEKWKKVDIDTLRTITLCKFRQNRKLGERLRTSDYTKFYECTTNQKWGTGVTLPASREIDTSSFTGSNHFGQILAAVKERLINEHQKSISHSATST